MGSGIGVGLQQPPDGLVEFEFAQRRSHLGVMRGERERVHDRAEMQPASADDHDRAVVGFEPFDRDALEHLDGQLDVWFGDVDELVGNLGAFGDRRLRGPDVHAAVGLHRIDREDHRPDPASDLHRKCALAGRRGSDDRQEGQIGTPPR